MCAYQLDIFEPMPDEIDLLRSQYIDLFNRSERVRKGCYKEINMLSKEIIRIKEMQEAQGIKISALERAFLKNTPETLAVESIFGAISK